MNITKEQRDKFIEDAAARFIEVAGVTKEQAMDFALGFTIDEWISDGYNGSDAADEEMSCWDDDGDAS